MKSNTTAWMAMIALGSLTAFGPMALGAEGQPPDTAPRPAGERGQAIRERLQRIGEQLALTTEQKEKVRAVFQDEMEKGRALREDTTLSREDRRAKMQKIREDMQAKMKTILTADQWAKWEKIREEERERMRQRGGGQGGQGGGQPQRGNSAGAGGTAQ
jgi:Spy/CpxP family protein refolding chaperone